MSQISVVLIEDHDLTRVGLRTAFQQRHEVKVIGEAANGQEGLELAIDIKPDIAIVDIGLPDIDGIEVTRRLKNNGSASRESKQKVLILTMQDNNETVLAAFAAGADSYCMKDVNLEKLIEALIVTQEGNSWVDPTIAKIVLQQARNNSTSGRSAGFGGAARPKPIPVRNSPELSQLLQTSPLTERELQVLELIVAGFSNAAIGDRLYITVGTVKTHVRNILNKLCADDRTQAAVRALRSGLVG
ncbi:MAG: response regulator transcription factor [Hormoscilla sp. SP12CHS1]|nr:response regulator transcription factor [Hormoscilla sp. SP12CHS1]